MVYVTLFVILLVLGATPSFTFFYAIYYFVYYAVQSFILLHFLFIAGPYLTVQASPSYA